MAPPCHREIVYLASFKEQLGSEQIFGKKKNLRCGLMMMMMKSIMHFRRCDTKESTIILKFQYPSMLHFETWIFIEELRQKEVNGLMLLHLDACVS